MEKSKYYKAFEQAYNNFVARPLSGAEELRKFYVADFTKSSVDQIVNILRMKDRSKKVLVIGHRGCGKSTILNKVAEDLEPQYHVVRFSATDTINMMDVEAIDLLFAAHLQVSNFVGDKSKSMVDSLRQFRELVDKRLKLSVEEANFFGIVSAKFRVEPESRANIRRSLSNEIGVLQKSLCDVCDSIRAQNNKEVLIIIDDLDKLDGPTAEKVFFENSALLTLPEAKIVYTFPLESYYSERFVSSMADRYTDRFVSLVNLYDVNGNYESVSEELLKKLIILRIGDRELITEEALKYVIQSSGGLLRDLVTFMQDACNLAMVLEAEVIDQALMATAVDEHVNKYLRNFDSSKYENAAREIAKTKQRNAVDNPTLVYLLRHLFVLEYSTSSALRGRLWYDVHPCLKQALGI